MKKNALIVVNLAGFLTFLWNDIEILKKMGYEVCVAGNGKMMDGSDAIELKQLAKMKIKFFQIDFDTKNPISMKNLKSFYQLKKIFAEHKFDLVHCHTPIAGILTRLSAKKIRKKGCKIIYTSHGFAFTKNSSKKSWLIFYNAEKFCSKYTDAIITINSEDFKNAKNMRCKKVYCIPGVGLNVDKFKKTDIDISSYRNSIGVKKDDYMILSVGELSTRKNHQIIIKAIGNIEEKSNIVYVICGREVVDSNIGNDLRKLAEKEKVNLILLGHRKDVCQLYKCANISAIPSIREGLGMAGLEALASGIPLIGSDVQGIKEYLKNDITGYLCDPYDSNSFTEAIIKLRNKKSVELKKMSKQCIEMAEKFDVSISKKKIEEIYAEVLS